MTRLADVRDGGMMMPGSRIVLLASAAIVSTALRAGMALGQQVPAAQPGTDVGKVSTSGADTEDGTVIVPNPSGTRAQAREVKKLAPNEIEVQPQSEIQKLPDVNVAEALQRIPGTSLETDSGEGRFINIRGLDADLNGTSFGGVRILPSNLSSPQGGGRAVAYDALPAALVGSIEVIKSLRPEDDAEGLGGAVNLIPRTPAADGTPFLSTTAGLGLETLRNTQVLDYGVSFGASFGLVPGTGPFDHPAPGSGSGWITNPRPFSLFFTDTQHNDFRGVDDWEPSYSDQQSSGAPDKLLSSVDLRHYLYNRRRYSRGGEFDFTPNDENAYYFRYASAGYTEHAGKDFLTLGGLDSGFGGAPGTQLYDASGKSFLAPAATADRTNTDQEETIGNKIISWGGRDVLFDLVKIDYFGAYSEGSDVIPYSYGSDFQIPNPVSIAYNNTADPNHLAFRTTDGTNLTNPNLYGLLSVSNGTSQSLDREWSGAFNVTVPVSLLGTDEQVKGGAILRLRDRTASQTSQAYFNLPGTTLANYTSGPDLVFYDGAYNIGPSINAQSIRNITTQSGVFAVEDTIGDGQAFSHDTENVYAGYAEYQGNFGKLGVLTGVRMEQTFGIYRGNAAISTLDPDQEATVTTLVPSVFKHAYVDYFPSLQLKYTITKDFIARAIYSTALARPGFDEISPSTTIDRVNNAVNIGNPGLGATYGNNFDVSLEYYLPRGGLISAAGFDKEFTGYVLPRVSIQPYTFPGFTQPTPGVTVNTYSTSGHSRVYGVEANYTQQFLFLPVPFDGFGVDANLTYNQSEVGFRRDRGDGVQGVETLELPSTSPWNFNASVFYEAHNVTFRLAASYVSKDISALGSTKALDQYSQARFRLDLGTAYQLTKQVELYFDAKNLTDTPLKFTETASASRPIQREFYGVDILGGVRANF